MKTLTHNQREPLLEQESQQQVKGLLRTFVALRHRNFRLFFFVYLI